MIFRWAALIVLVACAAISISYRWRARRASGTIPRRREGGWLMAGRAVVALPLFIGVIAYVVSPRSMAWASLEIPTWARWVGVWVGALTIPCVWWVFQSLGRNVSETVLTKDQHALVTHGPYRWVRHPLYAVAGTALVAIGLMAANWFILLFATAAVVLIRLVVVPIEERELQRKFGEAYRAYMSRSGCMVPRARTNG
jgi:protein-S-isoprenylcysteine O-methyltransferase Ste14